ncbi:hypothetical protein SDC9_174068 [bioreactor metagenome]|uniref:Uncharacterized protein n=1 Tax=bioreactor metagenome TaxID=1076179 RepID=A0A645GSP1_9ZZZZ
MIPYIQRGADGTDKRDASIICCPTFNTSTTPIRTINDVVFIILVTRLIAVGTNLLIVCGIII